ncbi:AAA family ATPase [Diaphorobacter sp. HDW4B]|uniref:ExeA family protein n=1 Tax=Diaphorobacter sp. HDW4B TaxID=2714925 RepID=UPI00140A013D|nr:ExeA family protein [Diaphorobacter sp. HDW4B]QIL70331.1 AAA family ATPase [Diaphorobacter sp. HDW4B]
MYASFFGLEHQPFSIAPDPRYLFMSDRHREALAHLLYGLDAGGGFVLLTGEVGTGKTTVCRCFLEQIPAHCNVAYIFNPKLTVLELLRSICDEFGVVHAASVPGSETVKDCIDPLNAFLLESHARGRNNVLIIDEAQNLAPDVLEQLRLLTNLETSERKLLQIILIGQPELRTMVAEPSMEQLAQRVIARYHLDALSLDETRQYVAHRLNVAGLKGPSPFGEKALQRVHTLAGGVPRRINLLCDRSLLGAYSSGSREVSETVVKQAAREVFDAKSKALANAQHARRESAVSRIWWPVGALALALVAGGAGWALRGESGPGAAAVAKPSAAESAVPASVASAPKVTASAAASEASQATPAQAPASSASSASSISSASSAMELEQFLNAQSADDGFAAWKVLASNWNLKLTGKSADPCPALARGGVQCYRNRKAGLALVRQLNRPVLLTLVANRDGQPVKVSAVLEGLNEEDAWLEGANGSQLVIPVSELASLWHGEITTFWRAPKALAEGADPMTNPAAQEWLDEQLARSLGSKAKAVSGKPATVRRERIRQFQLAQGITPDGQPGPLTLMLLNRAAGVTEPRLRTGA